MHRLDDLSRLITQALANRQILRHQENMLSSFWYEAEASSIGQTCYQVEELVSGPQLKAFMQVVHLDELQWRIYKFAFLEDCRSQLAGSQL